MVPRVSVSPDLVKVLRWCLLFGKLDWALSDEKGAEFEEIRETNGKKDVKNQMILSTNP